MIDKILKHVEYRAEVDYLHSVKDHLLKDMEAAEPKIVLSMHGFSGIKQKHDDIIAYRDFRLIHPDRMANVEIIIDNRTSIKEARRLLSKARYMLKVNYNGILDEDYRDDNIFDNKDFRKILKSYEDCPF